MNNGLSTGFFGQQLELKTSNLIINLIQTKMKKVIQNQNQNQNQMKKVNLNVSLFGLDGVEILNSNAGKLIGQSLAQATKGDALKQWSLATRLYSGEELELDASDLQLLKSHVEQSETFTALAKAQILTILNDAK